MNLNDIETKDWIEFQRRYPFAYDFLLGRSLQNEYFNLQLELNKLNVTPGRKCWITSRLKELEFVVKES